MDTFLKLWFAAILIVLSVGAFCGTKAKNDSTFNGNETKEAINYLNENWKTPEKYILDKFESYDIIFLSEDHATKHNLDLCRNLIPMLYEAGVCTLGMEFGASEDQEWLDSLVTAPVYDEEMARKIMFNYNVGWAFVEYMDLYRAAWELNNTLDSSSKKFRIVNLSYKYNWASCNKESFGRKTPETVGKIFYKGGTEIYRAQVVKDLILDKNEKILILTGGGHAFTKYKTPEYDYYAEKFIRFNDRTFGNLVYKMVPQKTFTILLHYPFESKNAGKMLRPAMGMIDSVMQHFIDKRVGFDLDNTPLGEFRDTSYFSYGYPDFHLSQMADGYIYQKPFAEYQGCTIDEKFFKEEDWPEIQKEFPDKDIRALPQSLEQYRSQISCYLDFSLRYRDVR